MPSSQTPTPEQVARASALLSRPQHYAHFFEGLQNAAWLQPLRSLGYFTRPPGPVPDGEGYVMYPVWPESRYLARMAAINEATAREVLAVIRGMPATTNTRIHEDFADAALAMPPALAAELTPDAEGWIATMPRLLLPLKLGQLVAHLARGGEIAAAVRLAAVLLQVSRDPRTVEERTVGGVEVSPRPHVRTDIWDYARICREQIPLLVAAAGTDALQMLCSRLNAAVRFSQRDPRHRGPEDYSWIWRRRIEPAPARNEDEFDREEHDVAGVLVSVVRDAAEQIAKADPARVPEMVGILEGFRWWIFHRIALHLLRRFPDRAGELVAARLTDRERFEAPALWHEYTLLLRDCFASLTSEQQAEILAWIDSGHDPADIAAIWEIRKEEPGVPSKEDYAERYQQHWQLKHLARFGDALPSEWRNRRDALARDRGELEQPDFATATSTVRSGPNSPMSVDELRGMDSEALIEYLRTWRGTSWNPIDPSPEGLGRALSALVAENPRRFIAVAEQFRALDPIYVNALLGGLRDAVRADRVFDWDAAIALCGWVASRPWGEPAGGVDNWFAPERWARGAAADLLEAGLSAVGDAMIPFALREALWRALQPLTDDPDPTGDAADTDPATRSINTTRGKAMHAVVHYALWVRRHLGDAVDLGALPEVRAVLDTHLDPSRDPSRAIRAVYGQWFPWLAQLDAKWASDSLSAIFPRDPAHSGLRNAAWETYLSFCSPYDDTLTVLIDEYRHAAGELTAVDQEREPEQHLAEHLMAYYGRGRLNLDEPDGVLARFYAAASPSLRGHALEFVGRQLLHAEVVPPAILARFRALWERRLAAARDNDNEADFEEELSAFGWWFASRKFEDVWAVAQLEMALELVSSTEPEHLVLERLAAIVPDNPLAAVRCLRRLIEGDTRGWALIGQEEQARTVLMASLAAGGEAQNVANSTIDLLGRRGHLSYGTLRNQGVP